MARIAVKFDEREQGHLATVTIENMAKANNLSWYVSTQNHYSLVYRHVELEILPFCNAYDTGFIPYFPLAGGFLTGQYRPGQSAPVGTRSDLIPTSFVNKVRTKRTENLLLQLESFSQEHGHPVAELALAWLLSHPEVTTIINGAEKPEYIEENAKAAEWVLKPEERAEVDVITSSKLVRSSSAFSLALLPSAE